jgi:hypothetical protein
MDEKIRKLWARTHIRLWPETYRLVSLRHESLSLAAEMVSRSTGRFSALVVEKDEVSLTVEETLWNSRSESVPHRTVSGPYRVITFQLDVDLGVCGYFAPAAVLLAKAQIPIIPQCAFLKDHVLVREAGAVQAMEILNALVKGCAAIG